MTRVGLTLQKAEKWYEALFSLYLNYICLTILYWRRRQESWKIIIPIRCDNSRKRYPIDMELQYFLVHFDIL